MKKVLLTGATGNMGFEGLKHLLASKEDYQIAILSLPGKKERKTLRKYIHDNRISITWGDLTNFQDVKKAVAGVDIVLHVGAFVSPAADRNPDLAWKINFEGTKNIVDAIVERDDSDKLKLVYIGTVAETGNRPAPFHWGRIGDPLVPSAYDYYALSKIAAERYVIESGLKNWVSLRQTGIMHENIVDVNDGIGYHQPLNNHLEWVTAHDSGKLLLNICSDDIPEDFWANVYNIGGGALCRLTAYEFMDKLYSAMGVDLRTLQDPNWFATRNFHGQYYYDSDKLEEILHYRSESIDDVLAQLKKKLPFSMKMLKYLPKKWVKEKVMRPQAMKGDTPVRWIAENDLDKISAFFGSRKQWEEIPGWDEFELLSDPPNTKLEHGYDEGKDDLDLGLEDIRKAASFRGGKCISVSMNKGDLSTKLKWICVHGHEFEASPYLVLKTGHWCQECLKTPWNFDEQARVNPYLAQIWYSDHQKDENHAYE